MCCFWFTHGNMSQLLFLVSQSMNSTFEIGLQNVVINGGVLLGLGGHEGLSDFPKSLTFPSCCDCLQADGQGVCLWCLV